MNIIGYCRVSSDEQSHGFSLNAQEDAITRYCRNNNHDLLGIYKEDYTGFKDFNRPEWRKIEEYLKKNNLTSIEKSKIYIDKKIFNYLNYATLILVINIT